MVGLDLDGVCSSGWGGEVLASFSFDLEGR